MVWFAMVYLITYIIARDLPVESLLMFQTKAVHIYADQ